MVLSNKVEKVIIFAVAALIVMAYVLTYSASFRSVPAEIFSKMGMVQTTIESEAAVPAADDPTYILPSNSRLLTEEDLAGLDQWTSTLAINELYARYGCQFGIAEVQEHFESQPWYANVSTEMAAAAFTDIERANLDLLVAHAQANGWR